MDAINVQTFNFNKQETSKRARLLIEKDKYWVYLAKDKVSGKNIGFISAFEGYSLYSEGEFGTIPELYIRPEYRSENIGQLLLQKIAQLASCRGWNRLEVTTPPLPEFERTLNFYQKNGFEVTGGKKLKIELNAS